MYNVMGAMRSCREVKFDSCNNLLSSVHTILVIIMRYARLNIKTKILLSEAYSHPTNHIHQPTYSSFLCVALRFIGLLPTPLIHAHHAQQPPPKMAAYTVGLLQAYTVVLFKLFSNTASHLL